jgi:hypothetical protein
VIDGIICGPDVPPEAKHMFQMLLDTEFFDFSKTVVNIVSELVMQLKMLVNDLQEHHIDEIID